MRLSGAWARGGGGPQAVGRGGGSCGLHALGVLPSPGRGRVGPVRYGSGLPCPHLAGPGRARLVWSVPARAGGARLELLLRRVRGGLVRYGLGWSVVVRCGLCRGGVAKDGSQQSGTVGAGSRSMDPRSGWWRSSLSQAGSRLYGPVRYGSVLVGLALAGVPRPRPCRTGVVRAGVVRAGVVGAGVARAGVARAVLGWSGSAWCGRWYSRRSSPGSLLGAPVLGVAGIEVSGLGRCGDEP